MTNTVTTNNAEKVSYIIYIGHKAEAINEMYSTYYRYPHETEAGFYFRAEDIDYIGNKGTAIYTNCFTESELKEDLLSKLLLDL